VFQAMWKTVGENIAAYRSYPRLVGETGGKDFILAHPSADAQELAVAMVRGGFEYQGQKCSAASRVYVPQSLWSEVRDRTIAMMREIKMGDVRDFSNFMSAVIDRKSFDKIGGYLSHAKEHATILQGGGLHGEEGFYVEPTLVQTDDPAYRSLCEEIFGPVLTVFVYPDAKWTETMDLVDRTSPYALTGSVFARDRRAVCGRQLLRQRQANRRRGRAAAVWRGAQVGHERQGRIQAEPDSMGECSNDQGNPRPGARLQVSLHGCGVKYLRASGRASRMR
jgi:1-pyrroline-5-carboxylate dehydrogenase